MVRTHRAAKQALLNGEGLDAAWELARQDEGLAPGTTKEQWGAWMRDLLAREAQTEQQFRGPV